MRVYDIIAKKRDGKLLSREEIQDVIGGCVEGTIPDYQLSALLMAIFLRGMTPEETTALTLAMADSGERIDLSALPGVTVDKHSTGGVGDKTTLIAGPIAAALGVCVAKMSGRGLGHTGGTIDKMESIPGLRIDLSREAFFSIVKQVGISVIGQSGNLVPADKKLYALRDVTATVESLPLIASSVMSKKIAAGADCILLDVKAGSGAFMKTRTQAKALAQMMVQIGQLAGKRMTALVTDMDQPLGHAVGNALEIKEVCETLQGKGPADLTELSLALAAEMAYLAGMDAKREVCLARAQAALQEGRAFAKLTEMVKAQGGDVSVLASPEKLPQARMEFPVFAAESGFVSSIDTDLCGTAAMLLGAGRAKKEDQIDYSAGVMLWKKTGDRVKEGESIATLYAADREKCELAKHALLQAYHYGKERPPKTPLILERITEKREA